MFYITNNSTVTDFIKHVNPNGYFLRNAFSQFFSSDIIYLLQKQGVETILERGGRYFPASNRSADVLRALLKWVKQKGAEIRCGYSVEKIIVKNGAVSGVQASGEKFSARKVILATGGNSCINK